MAMSKCPRCSTRFIEGETACEFCGYKVKSKFSLKRREGNISPQADVDVQPISPENIIQKLEREEQEKVKALKKEFRKSEFRLTLWIFRFLFILVVFVVLVGFLGSSF
jgi:hypothetical protein